MFSSSANGLAELAVTVPDTITTWVLQAVAVNSVTGFGMAKPLNLLASQEFFVSLKLPYSAQRGEQVSIMATVFNYAGIDITVCSLKVAVVVTWFESKAVVKIRVTQGRLLVETSFLFCIG